MKLIVVIFAIGITLVHGQITNGDEPNCTHPAIDDFPKDFFTEQQRQSGAVVLHIICSLYLFLALAVVCDKYFVPAVEKICTALNVSNDVVGATFMAAATSAPELFINVIGTFITEGDIGISTIVGSAVFNILGVTACCGIGAGMVFLFIPCEMLLMQIKIFFLVVPLDWWPLTRDCSAYGITVAMLICIIHDERVEWYKALTLVLLYIVYIAVMYYDKSIQKCTRGGIRDSQSLRSQSRSFESKFNQDEESTHSLTTKHFQQNRNFENIDASTNELTAVDVNKTFINKLYADDLVESDLSKAANDAKIEVVKEPLDQPKEMDEVEMILKGYSLMRLPKEKSSFRNIMWFVIWPIHFLFMLTIPDCERPRLKKLFPITFLMCIIWIGSLSYLVAWMITIIGDTLKIPDSIMGLTFLAAGTSVPEAVSSVIVAKQGHGSMGMSNSIGSNTFDILLCLGLPWLIKALFVPVTPGNYFVGINSSGIEYSAISLLSTLLLLYVAFSLNKFKLDRKVGFTCLLMYAVFLVFANLVELNVFFRVSLPTCGR